VDNETRADRVEAGVHRQVGAALADAAVAIMVVDVETGCVPLDETIAAWLRASGCATVIAVSKADNPERDLQADDFARLGFPLFPVSALHNRGFDALVKAIVPMLPEAATEADAGDPLRVAIVGRPNVGKSSYINRLLGDERVIVSDVPGTTRDSIDVPFSVGRGSQARHYLLIDTAGVRRAGKIRNVVERFSRMRTEASIARAQVVVLVLDAEQGPTAQDKKVAAMIAEHQRGAVVLVNKWDRAPSTQRQYDPALRQAMPFLRHCPIVYVSAETGYNVRRGLEAIDRVGMQIKNRLPTGVLNRVLEEAGKRVHAPAVQGKRLKIFYAVQVGTEPVRVRLFVNHPRTVTDAYREYLIRSLREKFGLEGAPVVLQIAGRSRN
jgi:GTP-binding protein